MRSKFALLLLASAVAGCNTLPDEPSRGMAAVNVPVVQRTDYALDLAAPDGMLSPAEMGRLDGWFRGLDLGYGDSVYVEGGYSEAARAQVAQAAGQYGLLLSAGAPIMAGVLNSGAVRVIVSRNRASVPNCPNWNEPSQPNYSNKSMPGFGCAVNSNLAAMVANPQDLVHGREGSGVGDALTATKAVQSYRTAKPTGTEGLIDISTKKEQ